MDQVTRVVLALEGPEVTEEVMHFLDRSGRARVVATAADDRQLTEAIRQLEPDAVIAEPSLLGRRNGGGVVLALDTRESVSSLRARDRGGSGRVLPVACGTRRARRGRRGGRPPGARAGELGHGDRGYGGRGGVGVTFVCAPRRGAAAPRLGDPDRRGSDHRRRRAGARRAGRGERAGAGPHAHRRGRTR